MTTAGNDGGVAKRSRMLEQGRGGAGETFSRFLKDFELLEIVFLDAQLSHLVTVVGVAKWSRIVTLWER